MTLIASIFEFEVETNKNGFKIVCSRDEDPNSDVGVHWYDCPRSRPQHLPLHIRNHVVIVGVYAVVSM